MTKSGKIEKNREIKGFKRLDNGQRRFDKGNQIGRMPKKGFTLNDLTKLVINYEKAQKKGKDALLKHYIDRLFKNDWLLARFMDKYVPTKSINELTGAGGEPLSIILRELIYKKDKKEESGDAKNV